MSLTLMAALVFGMMFLRVLLELQLTNLQMLCADCNVGKGAWDETDWRPGPQKQQIGA